MTEINLYQAFRLIREKGTINYRYRDVDTVFETDNYFVFFFSTGDDVCALTELVDRHSGEVTLKSALSLAADKDFMENRRRIGPQGVTKAGRRKG